jgi:hypothetical protein
VPPVVPVYVTPVKVTMAFGVGDDNVMFVVEPLHKLAVVFETVKTGVGFTRTVVVWVATLLQPLADTLNV